MATEKQIEANRLNAQKSTGPTSDEGKEKSSANAFRHGLAAHVHVFPGGEAEHFNAFVNDYIDALKPEGHIEQRFAERIATAEYRLARVGAAEQTIFTSTYCCEDPATRDEISIAFAHAKTFLERGKELERLTLYEQRIRRAIEKDMRELEKLQAERKAERVQVVEEAKQLAMAAHASGETYDPAPDFPPEIGFVLSTVEINAAIDRDRRFEIGKTAAHEQKSRLTAVPKAA